MTGDGFPIRVLDPVARSYGKGHSEGIKKWEKCISSPLFSSGNKPVTTRRDKHLELRTFFILAFLFY